MCLLGKLYVLNAIVKEAYRSCLLVYVIFLVTIIDFDMKMCRLLIFG